jgi:hypothetical protein
VIPVTLTFCVIRALAILMNLPVTAEKRKKLRSTIFLPIIDSWVGDAGTLESCAVPKSASIEKLHHGHVGKIFQAIDYQAREQLGCGADLDNVDLVLDPPQRLDASREGGVRGV